MPMAKLLWKGIRYEWTQECQRSFYELKQRLRTVPVLVLLYGLGGDMRYIVMLPTKKWDE